MSTITTPSPQSIADPHDATAAKVAIDKVLSVAKTTEQVLEQVSEEIEEVFTTPPQGQEGEETPQEGDDDVTVVKDDTPVNSEDEDDASSSDDDDSDNSSMVEELEQDVDDKTSENATLQAENKALKVENKALKAELDALKAALAKAREQAHAKLTAKKSKKSKKKSKKKKTVRGEIYAKCHKGLKEKIVDGMPFGQLLEQEYNRCQQHKSNVPFYRDMLKANGFNLPPAKQAAPKPERVLELMAYHGTKETINFVYLKYGAGHGSVIAKRVQDWEKLNEKLPKDSKIPMPDEFVKARANSKKYSKLMEEGQRKEFAKYIVERKEDILKYYVSMKNKAESTRATVEEKKRKREGSSSEADSSKKARTE